MRVPAALARFGPGHWAILVSSALAVGAAAVLGRRLRGRPHADAVARCIAYAIVGALLAGPLTHYGGGRLTLRNALPLELCDAAALACAWALWGRRQLPFELSYFWGLGGATQALLTPPPDPGLAGPSLGRYVIAHAATIAGVFYLGPGLGLRPRRGAWRATLLVTIGVAIVVGLADWVLGANYMWLRSKPGGSVLEMFGPWPWYILGATGLAAAIFFLLEVPYRGGGGGAGEGGGT
jgi:hypothetical integral membrane protein (TIGR02206 family)